jgi:RNA polymerase-binding protein DksA
VTTSSDRATTTATTNGGPHAGPSPAALTSTERDELRRLLVDERAHLLEQADLLVDDHGELQGTATYGRGESEHTTVEIERRVNAVLEANAREALAEIEAALARIDDGTYGVCEECGRPIPVERLRAMPATRYCVSCQERQGGRGR